MPVRARQAAIRLAARPEFWAALALLALLTFNAVFTPGFAALDFRAGRLYGAPIDILKNGSIVAILAVGMAVVIATGGIDLSVGSTMALSGAAAALLMVEHHWPALPALAAGLATGLAAGALCGLLVTRIGLQPIVATLVGLVCFRGLAQTLTSDQKVRFESPAFEWLGTGSTLGIPAPIILAAAIASATIFALCITPLGLWVESSGDSPEAAARCGVPVRRVRLGVYAWSGACAGLAGLIAAADIKEADVAGSGLYLELDAILAAVIGGASLTGGHARIAGAVIGALVVQSLTVMIQMRGVPTEHGLVIRAAAVLAVCLLQSPALRARLAASLPGARAHAR